LSTDLINQTLLKRYNVHEYVGRGGMAEVYKVWDRQRAVFLAMKLLREDFAEDEVFLRRFRREAKALAILQHPHIVRFYGLEQDGPLAFILMDFVEGSPLRREIFTSVQGFTNGRILEIMRPVCSALHYAHTNGVVHCDVKPANIMIDENGKVFVTDFGIARMSDAASITNIVMGTPAYMAPEQVRGLDPTPQTDIYATGIILYELLTGGERPFTGEEALTTGGISDKVRWEQLHLEPRTIREFNPAIPDELESVVFKCLSKTPQERYPNSLDLLNAIEFGFTNLDAEDSISVSRPLVTSDAARINYTDPKIGPRPIPVSNQKAFSWNLGTVLGVIGIFSLLFAIFLVLTNQSLNPFAGTEEFTPVQTVADTDIPPIETEPVETEDAMLLLLTDTPVPSPTDTLEPTITWTASQTPSPTITVVDLQICKSFDEGGELYQPDEICIFAVGSSPQFVTIKFPTPPDFEIYLQVQRDRFNCLTPEYFPEGFYCTGPVKPTLIQLPITVYRFEDDQVLAEGWFAFFPNTPTPTPDNQATQCVGEGCEDNLLPTETP